MSEANPMAWLPFSIAEAALSGRGDGTNDDEGDDDLAAAWAHLLERLQASERLVATAPVTRNPIDHASGMRHLLVLLGVGIDEALRVDPDPVLAVGRTSTDDVLTWGMECPDCLYLRATLRGGESYRVYGNRGTARYVGLQTMNGMASTANALVDELEVDPNGDVEVILSEDRHAGNWLRTDGEHPTLIVRHFFYDWDTEVPSSLRIERIGDGGAPADRPLTLEAAVPRQIRALGDFVHDNLTFFLDFNAAPPVNGFLPPIDRSDIGAAAENRPVIGRWELEPDEALILEVTPPEGVYWSYSLGNQWWETIHYGRRQSSLNGHQAVVDSDGVLRVVVSSRDPGVANWLDAAGHSNGSMILRCVRTDTAPVPEVRRVQFADLATELPPDTHTVTPQERAGVIARRRRAVHERFAT